MEPVTIAQYAQKAGVSYEAVRQQLKRYADQLEGHITKQGRKQYLDEIAVSFLDSHRNPNVVTLVSDDAALKDAKIQELQEQLVKAYALLADREKQIADAQKERADAYMLLADKEREVSELRLMIADKSQLEPNAAAAAGEDQSEIQPAKKPWWRFW